jgi:nucleoid DNA-binding protein
MNLQVRKLNAIEYIIGLKDEKVFNKIETAIIESQRVELKQFSKKQIIDRAKQANKDYSTGNFKTQEQLEAESENW